MNIKTWTKAKLSNWAEELKYWFVEQIQLLPAQMSAALKIFGGTLAAIFIGVVIGIGSPIAGMVAGLLIFLAVLADNEQ